MVWKFWRKKYLLSLLVFESRTVQLLAQSLYAYVCSSSFVIDYCYCFLVGCQFVPFFSRDGPVFKRNLPVPRELFFSERFLILQINHSRHCSNAICLHPTPVVSEFAGYYFRFRACVGVNRSAVGLEMLAVL
jgi:hypothetical protein